MDVHKARDHETWRTLSKMSLDYKAEQNWLTYSKLEKLPDRVELELYNRKSMPHLRIDVQGFIWASIRIEEGDYERPTNCW